MLSQHLHLQNLVPDVWFEQTTYRLQGDCTTTVLIRQYTTESFLRFQLQVECFLVAEPILKLGSSGRDRTYDQLINSQLHYRCATLEYSIIIPQTRYNVNGGGGWIRTNSLRENGFTVRRSSPTLQHLHVWYPVKVTLLGLTIISRVLYF